MKGQRDKLPLIMNTKEPMDKNINSSTTVESISKTGLDANLSFIEEWQKESYKSEIQELVSAKETIVYINKMTETLATLYQDSTTSNDTSNNVSVEKMEWETLHEVASNIMQEYTTKIDEIMNKLTDLNRRVMLWQESAFIMDSHRGIDQVGNVQGWIILKETYLDYKRRVLNDSVCEIKNTVARLPNH